jgi:hypothetical protein
MYTCAIQAWEGKLKPLTGIFGHSDACHIVTMEIWWKRIFGRERKSSKAINCTLIEENFPDPRGRIVKLRPEIFGKNE